MPAATLELTWAINWNVAVEPAGRTPKTAGPLVWVYDKTVVPATTVARALVYGFDLGEDRGLALLLEHYNPRCVPPWSEKELLHKVKDASSNPFGKPRGWLGRRARGGLRQSQRIGDYVLAHAYLRQDRILDGAVPPDIPIPALAEVQVALQSAAMEVTGEKGEAAI